MSNNELDIVKKANTKSSYTEQTMMELVQCVEDPFYFMRNFMKIQHPIRGALPFEPYPFQLDIINAFHDNRFTIALTARQMGKALVLDTPILTPSGFKTVGDLKVGDTIYGKDGKPANVSFITETMLDHACYDVRFSHGETIRADAGHLWTVRLPTRSGKNVTVNTEELRALHARYKASGQSVSIEHCSVVDFEDRSSPVDPYMFGVWLGDGHTAESIVTCHIDDYPHYEMAAEKAGYTASEFKPDSRRPTTGYFSIKGGFRAELRGLGALGNKHIPTSMIHTSEEKRLQLLRGLMDSDGTVEKNGVCRFYQSDEVLIKQVRFLLSSLGIKSTLRAKKTTNKDCFILTFSTSVEVCSLARKKDRLSRIKNHPKNTRIYIEEIVEAESLPVRCLQVDNDDHLFLCGETLIPTHNTTVAAGYLLWKAMFTPDTTILVTANKLNQALEIMDRIRFAYENTPNHIRSGVTEYNKGTIAFDNGSKIVARATSSDAGRGLSITLLYLDEFAFVPPNKAKDFWTSIQPVLSTGGACIITSTPKSDEDQFAQIWKGAIDNVDEYGNARKDNLGRNGFFAVKVPWSAHPERDEEWAAPFRESLGEAKFRQEFECDFVTDDETLINPLTLSGMRGVKPEFYTGTVRWYKDPSPNKTYCVALDPSLGTGRDYAAIQIFELPDMIQVAEWQHNMTAPRGQISNLLKMLMFIDQTLRDDIRQQGEPEIFWTVENNTIGEAVLQIIEDTGEERFPGIFVSEKKKKGSSRRFRKGLNTDNKKKLSACARFKSLVESGRMLLNSDQLIKELKMFVSSGAGFAAKPGGNDDLVSSTLLVVRMLETVLSWSNASGDLREHIGDDELFEDESEAMPVVI